MLLTTECGKLFQASIILVAEKLTWLEWWRRVLIDDLWWMCMLDKSFPNSFPNGLRLYNSGKFVVGCCMKFDYGSLVELGATVIFL